MTGFIAVLIVHSFFRSASRFSASFIIVLLCIMATAAQGAEYEDWAWMGGSTGAYSAGSHGTQGVAASPDILPDPTLGPGSRSQMASWADHEGNTWLFGGLNDSGDLFNDLWKFDPETNSWMWMKGSRTGKPFATGVYGTQGQAAPANTPGARQSASNWIDSQGNLWIFGGYGCGAGDTTTGHLNDLWKYDPLTNNWTWMRGHNAINHPGIYGQPGQTGSSFMPRSRMYGSSCVNASDELWLFGGFGSSGYFSDLWKYDIATNHWTLHHGSATADTLGVYDSRLGSLRPGARGRGAMWIHPSGDLILFGGTGFGSSANFSGTLNDLWRYMPGSGVSRWQFIKGSTTVNSAGSYGALGVEHDANVPSSRFSCQMYGEAVRYSESSQYLWMFGGYSSSSSSYCNDVWRLDVWSFRWTWMKGSNSSSNLRGIYGTKGVAAPSNQPGGRRGGGASFDRDGNLWMFGGQGHDDSDQRGTLSDLWKYNTKTNIWTWMHGPNNRNQPGTYSTQPGPFPWRSTKPGARQNGVSWTGSDGNLWMFGGSPAAAAWATYYNDIWKYDTAANTWTWVKGSKLVNQPGIYGEQETGAAENTPGARQGSGSWVDVQGNMWIFGGHGYATSATGANLLSDLWRFNPVSNTWTWMKGSNALNQPGNYGTKGQTAPDNAPGARQSPATWTDAQGSLWMFGGSTATVGGVSVMNDLWKYEPVSGNWTWMTGSNVSNQPGSYGSQGESAPGNTPGGRHQAVTWTDNEGNLWLFGGLGFGAGGGATYLNDVWKYNIATNSWTWMKGSSTVVTTSVYGTMGQAHPGNTPSGRSNCVSWTHAGRQLWIYGGVNPGGCHGDLWSFDPETNNWTWMKGTQSANTNTNLGTKGLPMPLNDPGAREGSLSWYDANHQLWLFGGFGITGNGVRGVMNDLWRMKLQPNSDVGGWEEY